MMRYWRKIQRCKGIIYTLLPERDEADKYFKKYRDLVPEDHPCAKLHLQMVYNAKKRSILSVYQGLILSC